MNVIDKVKEVVAQKLGLGETDIDESSEFVKLGADSLDLMEIAEELEEHYEIDLVLDDKECKVVNDLSKAIQEVVNDNT